MHTDLISRLQNARTGIHIASAIGTDKALLPAINELLDAAKEAEIALTAPQPATCNQPLQVQPEAKAGADDYPRAKRAIEARNDWLEKHPGDAVGGMLAALNAQPKPAEGGEVVAWMYEYPDGEESRIDFSVAPFLDSWVSAKSAKVTKLYTSAPPAADAEALAAFERLVSACEDDMAGPLTESEPDSEPVGVTSAGHTSVTFGMIRDARAHIRRLSGDAKGVG